MGILDKFEVDGENMMEWINVFGAVFIVVIMVPNIIYALKCRDGFENKWNNLIVNSILIILYCLIWIICFRKNTVFKALALSIIPAVIFMFSGIMSRSVLLIIASLLFAPAHILISYKNAKC